MNEIKWQTVNKNGRDIVFYRYTSKPNCKSLTKFLATKNEDGTFEISIFGGYFSSIEFVGEYLDFEEMLADSKKMIKRHPRGYVCHIASNAQNDYVFIYSIGVVDITL